MKRLVFATLLMGLAFNSVAADLTVVSFGGASKAVQSKAFFKPFEQSAKKQLVIGEWNGEMGMIKAMVDTHSVAWDVVQIEGSELMRGCEEGMFEKIDPAVFSDAVNYVPGTLTECGAGVLAWSMVMTYDSNRLTVAPSGWADFWDTQKYPGKRALRKGAKYTMEIALLADGVAPDQLYKVLRTPEGVERAFRKLDQIKSSIQWWESGAQPMQFLASGDVVMSTAYNGRVFAAQQEGAAMKLVWNGSLYAIDSWAIPKGSPNKRLAEEFMAFSLRPEQQKIHTEQLGYGSTNLKTNTLLSPGLVSQLNTAPQNLAQALPMDMGFWVDHGEDLEERFIMWAAR
ncbi:MULTISPECIES: ABC transporter substrate-binding protein [unclassified Pseudomonas]|jgi:Spermidine/putrescine-binding periplasmic protein|uniref:ABC transporter substrate-binding protein n=1 Tax=unclassified Pseudomonas TaxID=196821 RepID=UPI000488288F|nr:MULTISPECIES: ABC transporter substrate-binding protein [unclassified Pseudomonas]SME96668.1 putative spermidine/putrescine transport system substrate-binding protein [Pseudomonas sp. LAMO17WK12:I1]